MDEQNINIMLLLTDHVYYINAYYFFCKYEETWAELISNKYGRKLNVNYINSGQLIWN